MTVHTFSWSRISPGKEIVMVSVLTVGVTPTDASAAMAAHRLLSTVMWSNDDIDWPVHPLTLFFHDLRGLLLRRLSSTVPSNMIFSSVSWRATWPNHDNLRRLTVNSKSFWCPAKILTCCHTYSFVLSIRLLSLHNIASLSGMVESAAPVWSSVMFRLLGLCGSKVFELVYIF